MTRTTVDPSKRSPSDSPQFECEWDCGFDGDKGEVEAHEVDCEMRDRSVSDCGQPDRDGAQSSRDINWHGKPLSAVCHFLLDRVESLLVSQTLHDCSVAGDGGM